MVTNERTRKAWIRRILRALQIAAPTLQDLTAERDQRGVAHLKGKYQHWRPQGAWQTENDFSDGTLRLFGLLWAVLSGGGPLLLEEPELSLNPGVVRYLPQMFYQMQKRSGRQVIVSTHSPDLLIDEGIDPGEVLILTPSDEGTLVTPASNFQELVQVLKFGGNFGQAVMNKVGPRNAEQLPLFLKEKTT
jgi:predicted ATPase